MPTLPPWVAPAGLLNLQRDIDLENAIVTDGFVPIAYGEVQLPGKIFAAKYNATTRKFTVGYVLCMGEINAFVNTYLNGAAAVSGVTVNTYTGTTSQSADALLAAEISGYADTLIYDHPSGDIGIAYLVVQYTSAHYAAPPQVVVRLQGRKIFDPDSSAGIVYTANPACAVRDLITSVQLGLGESVNDTSVIAVADDNDALVSAESRRVVGIVLDQPLEVKQWIDILAAYAGAWAFKRGGTWQLVSDRPRSSDATLTMHDIVGGTFKPSVKDASDVPTVVRLTYTDTTTTIWRTREYVAEISGVSAGTVPRRESFVRMPGITKYSRAKREAEERLAKLQRGVVGFTWVGFDEQLAREQGDVVTLTHAYGFTARTIRLTEEPKIIAPGRIELVGVDYSASDYNDTETATPTWGAAEQIVGEEGSMPEHGANRGAPGVLPFTEDFSDNSLPRWQSEWFKAGAGAVSVVSETGTPPLMGGTYVLECGVGGGTDEVAANPNVDRCMPIVLNELYKVTWHVRRRAGSGTVNLGVVALQKDRATAITVGGEHHYFATFAENPGTNWITRVGYFKNDGATAANYRSGNTSPDLPGFLDPATEFIGPFFYVNRGAAGITQLGFCRVERVSLSPALGSHLASMVQGPSSLAAGVSISDGTTYRLGSKGFAVGACSDGDAVTFPTAWDELPIVRFLPGGLSYKASGLTGDQTQSFEALGVSTTGFTARLKLKELVGAGTLRTDSTISTPSSPSGIATSVNKVQTDEAYNDRYLVQFDVTVANFEYSDPEVGTIYFPGSVEVGVYSNDGGGWVKRASVGKAGGGGGTTPYTNVTCEITVDGMGLNDDFGINIDYDQYGGSTINLDNVKYTTATAPTEVSATPSGATQVPFIVIGGVGS